jgi:hypothetical protein
MAIFKTLLLRDETSFYVNGSINYYSYRILEAEQRDTRQIVTWYGLLCNRVIRCLCFSENVISFVMSIRLRNDS